MPLTELNGKAAGCRTPGGPIAVFSNSYARLPEHFFARLSPTPVANANLIKFNVSLAAELGVDTRGLRTGRVGGDICRQRHSVGRRADRDGLCRASIRQFRPSAWRRSRNPSGRGRGPQRRTTRYPIERRGPNAVLPTRRWPRLIRAGSARISRQRIHACARNSDHKGAGGRLDRRTCFSRSPVAWGRTHPRRIEPYPDRELPIFRRARRHGSG